MSKKNTILKFIENGEKIVKEEFHPASDEFPFSYVAGPKFTQWLIKRHQQLKKMLLLQLLSKQKIKM